MSAAWFIRSEISAMEAVISSAADVTDVLWDLAEPAMVINSEEVETSPSAIVFIVPTTSVTCSAITT